MSVKRAVLKMASTVNQAQTLLSVYEGIVGDMPWSPRLDVADELRNAHLDDDEREGYVLLPVLPAYDSLWMRFGVLGYAFRTRGYEPIILYEDDELPANLEFTIEDEGSRAKKEGYRYQTRRYFDVLGLESMSIGDVLGRDYELPAVDTSVRIPGSWIYQTLDLTGCVEASTRKYLKRYTLDDSDPTVRRAYEQFLKSGAMIADATQQLLETYDIEAVLVNEPNYIQGWIPLKLCHEAGIDAYTQGKGYHRGRVAFGRAANRNYRWNFADKTMTATAVETELSESQLETLARLFDERKSGDVTRMQYTPDDGSSVEVPQDRLVGVFSHLLWDGALEPEQAIYEDFFAWLRDTIDVGAEMENTHFVIKVHPAEQLSGTNESVMDWLDDHYDPLPENVSILPPDTPVNTYELIDDLDAGIVYASTVGLEMALEGVPVLVGGYPPYHGFGITHDPANKSEYVDCLRRIDTLGYGPERLRRAQRFAYFLFVCKHFDFPALNDGTRQLRRDDLGDDSTYVSMVTRILDGEEVIRPNCLGLP